MASNEKKAPQVKRRTKWLDLPQDEYEDFQIEIWVTAPTRLWMDLASGDEEKVNAAAAQLVLSHNGWLDFDGNEYPPPSDPKFWEDIPTELAACVFAVAKAEMERLPNSIAPNNRRSRRG